MMFGSPSVGDVLRLCVAHLALSAFRWLDARDCSCELCEVRR